MKLQWKEEQALRDSLRRNPEATIVGLAVRRAHENEIVREVLGGGPAVTECRSCFEPVDADGWTTTECPALGKPGECDDCGACYCDGSC